MIVKTRNIFRLSALFNNKNQVLLLNNSIIVKSFSTQSTKQIKSKNYLNEYHILNSVYREDGSINAVPKWYPLGFLKVLVCITTFVLLGSYISQSMAEFLEDNEIFVPEDDED